MRDRHVISDEKQESLFPRRAFSVTGIPGAFFAAKIKYATNFHVIDISLQLLVT